VEGVYAEVSAETSHAGVLGSQGQKSLSRKESLLRTQSTDSPLSPCFCERTEKCNFNHMLINFFLFSLFTDFSCVVFFLIVIL
jgi:hypothetical protein